VNVIIISQSNGLSEPTIYFLHRGSMTAILFTCGPNVRIVAVSQFSLRCNFGDLVVTGPPQEYSHRQYGDIWWKKIIFQWIRSFIHVHIRPCLLAYSVVWWKESFN